MHRIGRGVAKPANDHPTEELPVYNEEDLDNPKKQRLSTRPAKSTTAGSDGTGSSIALSQEIIPHSQKHIMATPSGTGKGEKQRKTPEELILCKKLRLMTEMSDRLQRHLPKIRATMLLADWGSIPDPEGRLRRAIEDWEEDTSNTLTQVWLSEIAIEMNAIIERHHLASKMGMGSLQRYLSEIPQYRLPETTKPEAASTSGTSTSSEGAGTKK